MYVMDLHVHFCSEEKESRVRIACDDAWTLPTWESESPILRALAKSDIFRSDDSRYYSREAERVTCPVCLEKMGLPVT